MSQQNIEIVKGWFERWNRGEREFPDEEIHPDVQVISRLQSEPFRDTSAFAGREAASDSRGSQN